MAGIRLLAAFSAHLNHAVCILQKNATIFHTLEYIKKKNIYICIHMEVRIIGNEGFGDYRDKFTLDGGAKTFRRGKVMKFLKILEVKRATLKKQLEIPELKSIHLVLVGELKAIETTIDDFVEFFDLNKVEEVEITTERSTSEGEEKN